MASNACALGAWRRMNVEFKHLEDQLRAEGAPLPPALRERVLRGCVEERRSRRCWHRRFDLRLLGAAAGLCLCYWGAMASLDTQRAALFGPASFKRNPSVSLLAALPRGQNVLMASSLGCCSDGVAQLLDIAEMDGLDCRKETRDVPQTTLVPSRTPANAKSG